MNFVTLPVLIERRLPDVSLSKLQRWCRKGWCHAKKLPDESGEWYVDIDQFDALYTGTSEASNDRTTTIAQCVVDKLAR